MRTQRNTNQTPTEWRGITKRFLHAFLLLVTISTLLNLQQSVWASETPATLAPDFTLPTSSGAVQLSTLKGKVVLVDFWASWCGPCRDSFPWMNAMHEKYASQGLEIIAINVDQEATEAQKFLEELPAKFTVAFDPEGKTPEAFNVMGMPSAYLIDQHGTIHSQHIGFHNSKKSEYEAAISALVQSRH
ncbi:MAG: TlpA family protein disulfide reductase [Hahellaceae bacterium]|jgi:thiol-disulfide isomerase/thioredoxin|nr:TlpA family protein disulfide reductase [Hahellaceae bacterium]MCP5211057.1 TlpA family protein disulfide reductase [Hahellaceae bacterium]